VGILLGSYMGGSGDHSLAPVHAHINLLGFTLMTAFGLGYRLLPGLATGWMPKAHFWLHQIGSLVLLLGLFAMMSGYADENTVGPMLAIFELAILIGAILWAVNLAAKTR
jgi:hypothetical protein